jgi:hypothetical protein
VRVWLGKDVTVDRRTHHQHVVTQPDSPLPTGRTSGTRRVIPLWAGPADPGWLTSLQRLAGNRATASLHAWASSGRRLAVQREEIALRSGKKVTDTSPGPGDNIREDVLALLGRLYGLWSIDNAAFPDQHSTVSAMAPNSQVPLTRPGPPVWSFRPTIDAIRRNREPHLAAAVINHFMGGLAVAGPVGQGQANAKNDVLAVQDRLNFLKPYPGYTAERAAAAAATGAVPESALPETLAAITAFKTGIAAGTAGWQTVRAGESDLGVDRFAGQTTSRSVTVPAKHEEGEPDTATISVSIFLPSKLTEKNDVAVFFSPGDGTETSAVQPGSNATNVHAMRSGADATSWIVIGVPGFRQRDHEAGWNAMTTAAIHGCLAAAGRPPRIDRLRLIAHSRGGRGLVTTVRRKLVDIGLLDKVIMLDQPHGTLDADLAASTPRGRKPPPVVDYTQSSAPGAARALNAETVRAIGFSRLIQDRPDRPPPPAAVALVAPIIADLPRRGGFTTGASGSGKVNVHDWAKKHSSAITAIATADSTAEKEWNRFVGNPVRPLQTALVAPSPGFHVNTQDLMRFFGSPLRDPATGAPRGAGFSLGIYAHHLFPAEFSEEFFQ